MKKNIVIGQFNDSYVPIMDGVTITVRNYAYWLDKIMGPTYVITPWVPLHVDNEPFPVIRYFSLPTIFRPPYRLGIPELDPKAQLALKNRDFKLVHTHSPFSAGRMALKIAKEKRIPIVATFHSKFRDDIMRVMPIKGFVDDQVKQIVDFFHEVDEVWVPQEGVSKTLREYGYKGPYRVMENGVDFVPPADFSVLAKLVDDELGLDPDAPLGLYVGQHTLEKNLDFLINALPAVCHALPKFRMVFIGEGYAKQQLKELSRNLGIRKRIIFHDVVYDRDIIQRYYARANIFLFPSKYDTWSLVMREAAAFKTPTIVLKGSTIAEAIQDRVNGYISEDSADAYAATIIEALSDSSRLEAIGLKASQTLYRSWESVVGDVKKRYKEILSQWA